MSFAVQLYFDAESDRAIRRLWEGVASVGLPFPLRNSGNRPHFSLAIYGEIDVPVCTNRLNSFAKTLSPFALSIVSLGIFSAEKTVVFLAPIVTSSLLDLHRQGHQLLPFRRPITSQDTGPLIVLSLRGCLLLFSLKWLGSAWEWLFLSLSPLKRLGSSSILQ